MKLKVTLSNSAGELDTKVIEVPADDVTLSDVVDQCEADGTDWLLSDGDTIRFEVVS